MPYKTFFTLVISLLLLTDGYSQQFKVTWTDNSNLKDDYDDAVQLNDGNYILLKFEKLKAFHFYQDLTPDPGLLLVNSSMSILKENKFSIGEKNDFDHRLIKYGNNVYLLYKVFDKGARTTYIYANKINEQTLSPMPRILLGAFDADSQYDEGEIKFSPDSSKVLVFAESSLSPKENKKFLINVLDTGFRKIWGRYAELPIADRFVSVYDQDITNDGKVFVAIKHYDKEVTRQAVRENGDRIPSYSYKLLIYSQDRVAAREVSFNLNNQFIQGTKLTYDKKGTITVAGLYKKKPNGNITGTFYASFDSTTTEINNPQIVAFPSDLLALIDNDGFGKSGGSDPGLNPGFSIKHMLTRANGSVDLIGEYFEYSSRSYTDKYTKFRKQDQNWIYGDIIDINLAKSGKANFTRVPKRQEAFETNHGFADDNGMGFYPIVQKDKLFLFYNDHEDNMTRDVEKEPKHFVWGRHEVFATAIIDANGNLLRKSIYGYENEDQAAIPTRMAHITDAKYLITSVKKSMLGTRTRFGVVEIK